MKLRVNLVQAHGEVGEQFRHEMILNIFLENNSEILGKKNK